MNFANIIEGPREKLGHEHKHVTNFWEHAHKLWDSFKVILRPYNQVSMRATRYNIYVSIAIFMMLVSRHGRVWHVGLDSHWITSRGSQRLYLGEFHEY